MPKTAPKKTTAKKKTAAPKKTAAKKAAAKKTAAKKAAPKPPAAKKKPANPLALLLRGVADFNAWRHRNLGAPLDLAGADLRGLDLRGAFLAGADLSRAQLDDAALNGAILSGATLDGASLRRADLRGSAFGACELVEAELAMSPVGSALLRGASLVGADLEAARASKSSFVECDLARANLVDCDLRESVLTRANLEGATRSGEAPDIDTSPEAFWARLAAEPQAVRDGIMLFGILVHIGGGNQPGSADVLSSLATSLGLDQDDIDRISPEGPIVLERVTITPPTSQWARRIAFILLTGVAGETVPVQGMQLQVLGQFGEQLGLTNRAMARIMGEELGLSLSVN